MKAQAKLQLEGPGWLKVDIDLDAVDLRQAAVVHVDLLGGVARWEGALAQVLTTGELTCGDEERQLSAAQLAWLRAQRDRVNDWLVDWGAARRWQ